MVQYAKVAATPKHPAASIDLEGASMTRDGTGPRDCALGARAWAVGVLKTEDSRFAGRSPMCAFLRLSRVRQFAICYQCVTVKP